MSKTILITGGTGLVGRHLSQLLIKNGYQVKLLGRKSGIINGFKCYKWDLEAHYLELEAFRDTDAIIHLAGAGIADKRWTDEYKKTIYDSRILSTRLLANTLTTTSHQVKTFISTSAIGIYGNDINGLAKEDYPTANTFLAKVCQDWEKETQPIMLQNIRTAVIRVGVVLARESGFVPEVSKPIKFGMGAALGSGKQLVSWIHIDDLCNLYLKALEDSTMQGPYNAVAPTPVDNNTITRMMAKLLNRPVFLPPVPFFALKLLFGEMATLLIANQGISSHKVEQAGFKYQFSDVEGALKQLLHTK